ncbi:MAG: hypothetical protein AAF721_13085 [Myxococcota bacterium]
MLGCKRCGGVFVDAALGLRLLAVLEPEVLPHDERDAHPLCPVCRVAMKRVRPGEMSADVDVCHKHGVWLDAVDLGPLARAAASALGKPVPDPIEELERGTVPATPPSRSGWTSFDRQESDTPRAGDSPSLVADALEFAVDVAATPVVVVETAARVALLPFDLTVRAMGGLIKLLD